MMTKSTFETVVALLSTTLSLGDRGEALVHASPLMGSMPEFDSMALVAVLTALEAEFGMTVHDDELSTEIFTTVGSLVDFVEAKLR